MAEKVEQQLRNIFEYIEFVENYFFKLDDDQQKSEGLQYIEKYHYFYNCFNEASHEALSLHEDAESLIRYLKCVKEMHDDLKHIVEGIQKKGNTSV